MDAMKRKQNPSRCGGEPTALGNRRTDGSYSHAGTSDGLPVRDEYRGCLLDGGTAFIAARHASASPPRLRNLLVRVNELPGMAQQPSFNPAALPAYNFNSGMQQVAQFYCHPAKGLGSHRNNSTALMEYALPLSGLSAVCADSEELSKINLREKASAVTE
jgi:hypothetical protein